MAGRKNLLGAVELVDFGRELRLAYEEGYKDAQKKFATPKGQWLKEGGNIVCSNCQKIGNNKFANYCWYCGADMR